MDATCRPRASPGDNPALNVTTDLIERLDRILPQTQCGQCGYAGCRPYAEAMARGDADIDQCPPGGDAGARALACVLGVAAKPFDRDRGPHKPAQVAVIVEADCIGCTKCIQACPVDAIIGGARHMHTVIEPLCTGCELCIPACPVDCIVLAAPLP
jgi:electron transport complex protein RnfB